LGAGVIKHTAESALLTNSSGTQTATFTTGDSVYITVEDGNRNLDGTAVETMSVSLNVDSSGGSDSEALTLTETGAATGIFRGSLALVNSSFVSTGNSQLEISATGVATSQYTDNQDSADVTSDTAALSYVSAAASGSSSGGGGLGSAGTQAIAPIQTQFQTYTQNIASLGLSIHALVKLPDDKDPNTQIDSAVYYIGADGKRHAFPNNRVYFTWYSSFDGVQIIGATQLASIPLGNNVTYKPGKKMVKFTTDAKVYAVSKGGILRWVKTEAAAVELYGTMWNQNIDDISDAFYSNYSFGADISSIADFNPAQVEASVAVPTDSLKM
jgi:hypothetical protein